MDLCERQYRDAVGRHLCSRSAGHDGQHVCGLAEVCGVRWAGVVDLTAWLADNAVRAHHLGPCATCGETVRAGTECSSCLEDDGVARHEASRCCGVCW